MTEIKTFKIEKKFKGVNSLYKYLLKNVGLLSELTGIKIEEPLTLRPFCLIAKEHILERNIIFFASKSEFPENLGELISLSAVFEASIIVFFLPKTNKAYLEPIKWLQSICNDETLFLVGEASF